MLELLFIFIDPCAGRRFLVCSRLGIPTAFATAGSMLAFVFILVSPCAGRHLLSLLRQESKQRKALHTANPKCPYTA
jgi:hypothetical protein